MSIPSGKRHPSYAELAVQLEQAQAQIKKAEARILELERALVRYAAHDRSQVTARREIAQGQPLLDLEAGCPPAQPESEADGAEDDEPEPLPYAPPHRKKRSRGRRKLPAHLPRETKTYTVNPAEDLPDYDPARSYKIIDHDSCEELVVSKAEPKVIVHKRPVVVYQTLAGEMRAVTVGGVAKVFPKCAASPEVLSRIAVDRLHNQMTLYRLAREFGELGCPLSRATLSYWMVWLGELLKPLARAQEEEILAGFKLHTDDTVVRVWALEQCDWVRVWVLLGGESAREIIFKYTEKRDAAAVKEILGAYEGHLQVDACGVYDQLYENGKLKETGCWSHAQRKFEDVALVDSRAKPMLRMIRDLYAVDSWGAGLQPEERRIFRLLAARPRLVKIRRWVDAELKKELLESTFRKALKYVVNQWAALQRFLDDGRLSLDNNIAEAEFHVFGVGRRNYLFWGSRRSLAANLVLLGLIRSCVANGIEPYIYLVDVIRRVATTETPARSLIPSRWKQLPPLPSQPAEPAAAVANTG
jgi:transposase